MENQYDGEAIDYLDLAKPKSRKAKMHPYGQLPDASVRSSSDQSVQQSMPVKETTNPAAVVQETGTDRAPMANNDQGSQRMEDKPELTRSPEKERHESSGLPMIRQKTGDYRNFD